MHRQALRGADKYDCRYEARQLVHPDDLTAGLSKDPQFHASMRLMNPALFKLLTLPSQSHFQPFTGTRVEAIIERCEQRGKGTKHGDLHNPSRAFYIYRLRVSQGQQDSATPNWSAITEDMFDALWSFDFIDLQFEHDHCALHRWSFSLSL